MTKVHGSNGTGVTVDRMDRAVATVNRVMYPAWMGAAIYRESSLVLALTALLRRAEVPVRTVAMIDAGVLAGTVCAMVEMGVTAAVFCRSVFRYGENRAEIKQSVGAHERFVRTMHQARMHARRGMSLADGMVDDAERERRTEVALPLDWQPGADAAVNAADDMGNAGDAAMAAGLADAPNWPNWPNAPGPDAMDTPLLGDKDAAIAWTAGMRHDNAEGIAAQIEDYAAHRAAVATAPERRRQLRDDGLAFGRDTVVQGGLAATNLALMWHAFDVGHLLHLAADVVSVTAGTMASGAFSVAMGVCHIVAATVSWRSARRVCRLAGNAREIVGALQGKLARVMHVQHAAAGGGAAVALPVCAALLEHAGRNETCVIHATRQQIFASKCRMAFGGTSLVLGIASFCLLVLFGAVTTGGLLIGVGAVLAGVAWLANATIRSHRHAAALDAMVSDLATGPALPSLEQAIADAVDLMDDRSGRGGAYPAARKQIKRLLLDMGMSSSDFAPLKWAPGAIRDEVRAELADTIRRYVAGDAMRRALEGVSPDHGAFVQAR